MLQADYKLISQGYGIDFYFYDLLPPLLEYLKYNNRYIRDAKLHKIYTNIVDLQAVLEEERLIYGYVNSEDMRRWYSELQIKKKALLKSLFSSLIDNFHLFTGSL